MYGTLEETETDITADDSYYTRRIGQAILDWEITKRYINIPQNNEDTI